MASDPYRPPDAALEGPLTASPRSLLVAVLLGFATEAAIAAVAQIAVPPVWDTRLVLSLGVGGFLSGWVAARYRHGTWLDTSLCLIAVSALPTFALLALSLASRRVPLSPSSVGQLLVHAAVTLAGGRLGWRPL
jgi:hypothetical protein